MTGGSPADEKTPRTPISPTNTDTSTLRGDVIIEIRDVAHSSPPLCSQPIEKDDAQPGPAKRPGFFRRVTSSFKATPEPEFVTETKTRTLENTPNGFPRLAAFQASDPNFGLYRSYSYLHSRVLLDLQGELTELEDELEQLDFDEKEEDEDLPRMKAAEAHLCEEDDVRTRRTVLRDIRAKLMEYDEVLIKVRTLESFQRPSERDYRSVRRYHHNTKPLMDAEMESVRCKEDIVSISTGRERAAFDGGVETLIGQIDGTVQKWFNLKQPPLLKYFRTPELAAKTKNTDISLYSATRIDKMVNIFITFVIFILLIVPIVTMYQLTSTITMDGSTPANTYRNTFNAVGVLIVFTLLFSAAMSVLTKAARHEMFAASAAYCAILVVFIGNFTGPNN
ncbi:uncharacterized protein M421DRAFT_100827 [Didymella exigua CBS 183.55]|uniref:DUF6594 domain-containing protein n=1 Tax=Didymella exigua CBS 183.55 TaxID=1150837 RepID=A0A6A5RS58_9PLEO|nr:uncharacterized protein M421DRAFT_100827 [Didymella exigua CBS 183.55]KAF1929146.1 hypothetical protein M421DRAFT_100827 [Didymella exigua CBS 183.55]